MSGAYFIGEEPPELLRRQRDSATEVALQAQRETAAVKAKLLEVEARSAELDLRNQELRHENERLEAELLAAKGLSADQDWTGSEESRSFWTGPSR